MVPEPSHPTDQPDRHDVAPRPAPRRLRPVLRAGGAAADPDRGGVTGEPALAEDAVAEAFARAWLRWPRLRSDPRPAVPWLLQVALNECRGRFRRHRVERRKAAPGGPGRRRPRSRARRPGTCGPPSPSCPSPTGP